MKRIFKKYGFLKYSILIAAIDLITRDSFEFGGGLFLLVGSIVAVAFMEIDRRLDEKEVQKKSKEFDKKVDRKKATA